ncbi:MAG TPA: twin-arginine translocase subunit TatC, partial [Candidatus Thermoplasmatota archaeon]|nr:twin-arginine translocase subunit TatC [Candidatus Thermoplasmatota archaeon]
GTFLQHVAELRRRLLVVAGTFLAAALVSLSVRVTPTAPYVAFAVYDPLAAQIFGRLRAHLVPSGVSLVVTRPAEAFTAQLTIALVIGFAIAIPVLLAQLAAFAGPALQPRERKVLARAILPAAALFAAGAAFCYSFVLPVVFETLYGFAEGLVDESFLHVGDLVGFSAVSMLLFGAAFQTPLLMYALARAGIVGPRGYARSWRVATFAIVALCAIATPDGSPVTLALVAGPILALYGLGIAISIPAARRAAAAA